MLSEEEKTVIAAAAEDEVGMALVDVVTTMAGIGIILRRVAAF